MNGPAHRLALVTGASSGIGAATAREFARLGYRVVLVARDPPKLERIATEIGDRATVHACDASDGSGVLTMADRIRADLGVPDVIVNAAGAGAWKRIEETMPEEAVRMMGAPYFAAFNVSHAFMDDMLGRGSGIIVHVGSPASFVAWPSSVGYTAARCALRGLHEALTADLHGTGVHSCHVIFGKVDSPYFETNVHAAERMPGISKLVPTIRPDQCARVITRLADRPRNTTFFPFALRLNYALFRIFPRLTRWLLRRTGYSRPADAGGG